MGRTIIRFYKNSSSIEDFELDPQHYAAKSLPCQLQVTISDSEIVALANGTAVDVVTEAGRHLMDELDRQPDVRAELQRVFSATTATPLYMRLDCGADEAAKLPWESLFADLGAGAKDFLALDNRFPIGRLVKSADLQDTHSLAQYSSTEKPQLNLLAILSAEGMCHLDEWEALWDASQRVVNKNYRFEIRYHVLVNSDDLKRHIESHLGDITVEFVTSVRQIQKVIRLFEPHIIHCFCHGQPSLLRVADAVDRAKKRGPGSIQITPLEIIQAVRKAKCDTWMTVLNCCDSGKSTLDTRAFAHNLVSPDLPVVIGMREPVDRSDASTFARIFYEELVDHIEAHLPFAGSPAQAVEWSELLWDPRKAIRERVGGPKTPPAVAAAAHKEWTLPVLYTVCDEFEFSPVPSNPAAQGTIQAMSAVQAMVNHVPTLPLAVKSLVDQVMASASRALED